MKKIVIVGSLALSLLIACNSDKNESATSTEQTTGNVETEEKGELESSFPIFFNELEEANPTFSADSIDVTETGNLQSLSATSIDEEKLQPFKKVLVYNSDSSKAVDLFSYNYLIREQNGEAVAEAAGPDTEVALVDFKNNSRKRIWYGGPSTLVLDAVWKGDNELLLATLQEDENRKKEAVIWKISLLHNTIDTYKSKDSVQLNVTDYLNKRFSAVKFR